MKKVPGGHHEKLIFTPPGNAISIRSPALRRSSFAFGSTVIVGVGSTGLTATGGLIGGVGSESGMR